MAAIAAEKSTNVRFSSPLFPVLSVLAAVAPSFAAGVAERALFTPRGRRASVRGDAFLATGTRHDLVVAGQRLAGWRWGAGRPVICVHGWAGSAAQFAVIAPILVARGYEVVAFDAPGHGRSSGKRSSILAMRDALRAVALRERAPVSVIAHSGGAAATTLAMVDDLRVARAVFVGPTVDPAALVEHRAMAAGVSALLLTGVKQRTAARLGVGWTALRILPHAAGRTQPLLVVHDRDDTEVPWTEGADLVDAWPRARLLLTRGLGHRKILYDAVVAESVAAFIAGVDLSSTVDVCMPQPSARADTPVLV